MQTLQPRISGTRDYAGQDAITLRSAQSAIEGVLRSYAYAAIDPPILERSSPFLDRSGEDIRRRMYIFSDPGGREVCLRPELTIPACRAYLRQLETPDSAEQYGPEREARVCYVGAAFRYESTGEGRYRQFYQAGAELIGAKRKQAADAEILAVATDALECTGLANPLVEVGDLGILHAFIEGLPIGERSKARLRRLALRNRKEARFVAAVSAQGSSEPDDQADLGALASLLATIETDKAELLIKEVFALADVRHVGGRTPEEIIERVISRSARQQGEQVSSELIQGIVGLLDIRGEPATVFASVRDHFAKFGINSIGPVLERCEERLALFAVYRGNGTAVEFNVGLRRGLEYYTGFVFEIFAQNVMQLGHLCGGGRYDNLLEALGAHLSIPAVGFAIGLDRLLTALQQTKPERASAGLPPHALVVAAGAVRQEECIGIAMALRRAGWVVEADASGRRARSALGYALKRKIPYLVFVGEDELKGGAVRIKRLSDRDDRLVPIASLDAFVKAETSR